MGLSLSACGILFHWSYVRFGSRSINRALNQFSFVAGVQYDGQNGARHDVACAKQERDDEWRRGDQSQEQHECNSGTEGLLFNEGEVFKSMKFYGAYHEEGDHIGQNEEGGSKVRGVQLKLVKEEDRGSNHDSRGWYGQSIESFGVDVAGLDVEPRKPQCSTGDKYEGTHPADASVRSKGPYINQKSGGYPKRDNIREGIKLQPETRGGLGEAGHLSVDAVEEAGDQDQSSCQQEFTLYRGDHAVKAEKDAR